MHDYTTHRLKWEPHPEIADIHAISSWSDFYLVRLGLRWGLLLLQGYTPTYTQMWYTLTNYLSLSLYLSLYLSLVLSLSVIEFCLNDLLIRLNGSFIRSNDLLIRPKEIFFFERFFHSFERFTKFVPTNLLFVCIIPLFVRMIY